MSAAEQDTVIVVGAGLAGLATAIGAAVNGRRVTVFEAADNVGGAAAYSGGQVWVGANHVAAREGIDDPERLHGGCTLLLLPGGEKCTRRGLRAVGSRLKIAHERGTLCGYRQVWLYGQRRWFPKDGDEGRQRIFFAK